MTQAAPPIGSAAARPASPAGRAAQAAPPSGRRGGPVATFSVERLRSGVNIALQPGASGTSGASGSSGSSGSSGASGSHGPTGSTGALVGPGLSELSGLSGLSGFSGETPPAVPGLSDPPRGLGTEPAGGVLSVPSPFPGLPSGQGLANNQGLAGQGSARQGLAAGGTGAGASGRRLAPGRTVRTAEPPAAADGEASATGSAEAPDAAAAAGTAAGTSTVAQTANQTDSLTGSETGTETGSQTGPQDQPAVGPGAFGRRYRPLDNGRIVEARLKTSEMTEEQRLGQLAQIRKSAEEYEGMLIAEMIKSMRQSPFVKTPGGDTYAEIAEKPFTAALTAAGGLGLAQTIITQVASQEGLGDTLDAHPEVMGPRYRARLSPSQMRKPGPRAVRPDGGGQAPAPAVAQAASEAASPADAESPAEL